MDIYNRVRQTIPMIYKPVCKVKFVHIIFITKLLKTQIIKLFVY